MGKAENRTDAIRRAATLAARQAGKLGTGSLAFYAGALTEAEAEAATVGLMAGAWRYDDVRTPPPEAERRAPVADALLLAPDAAVATRGAATGSAIGEGQSLARTLGMMPGNLCTPDFLAQTAREIAKRHGMQCTVLGRTEMEKEGMGSFLAVAQGAPQEDPKLIVLEYRHGPKDAKPVALVGKGLCFDTGGISIKPAGGMEDMKTDMGGAAAVAGLMHALAGRKAKVNAVGVLGLVENMPDGNAIRPGDILTSMSGQTVEVINTDAEGRLVLCDAIWYCQERFKPRAILDLATLTGAIVVALGDELAGYYSNDETLASNLAAASTSEDELLWRMPLHKPYDKKLDSLAADVKNITGNREAGSVTAALFIQRFVTNSAWAHLDIAGTAWKAPPGSPTIPEGATGFGVRLLNRLIADHYEGR
jgi:leucyl aminopeptidase